MSIFFYITYGFWFLSEIILGRLLRSKNTDKQNVDKGSLLIIWVLIIIANFSAVIISLNYSFPISNFTGIGFIGLAIIIFGVVLRLSIIASLGQYFTVNVTIKQNHQLKTDGYFKYLRHPSYAASLFSFIGFGISLNNWFSLIIVITLVIIAFSIRIKIEEAALTEHFGSAYQDYKSKTKKLIPFIY